MSVYKRLLPVFAVVCLSTTAWGQQSQTLRDRDPDLAAAKKLAADLQQANLHRGPFYLISRIRLSDAGFSESAFVPAGDASGGLSLTVEAPHRLYFVPRKKTIYSLELIPSYSWFNQGGRKGQFNYLVRGDAHFLLNHLYLDVYALRADQLRAHVADINRLATTREDEAGVAGEVKYSSRTSALFSVRLRETTYPLNRFQPDAPPATVIPVEVLDRTEQNGRFSLQHKTFPRTALFVAGEVSNYDFENKASYSSRRTYAGGGFHYDAGRTQVRFEAGPMKLDFKDPGQPDHEGLTAQLRASRANGRRNLYAGASRDVGFSLFLDNAFYIATAAHAGVDYTATRKLTLHARTAVERDDYETPVNGLDRRDDISFSSVGFTYGVRAVRFGADVGWYERDSTAFGDIDSGIRYVLRLSLTP